MGAAVGAIPTTSLTWPYTPTLSVCPVLGGMLQPRWRSGTLVPRAVPGTMNGCHHELHFQKVSMRVLRDTLIRKTTVHGHSSCADTPFGYYVRSLPRLKMRLWREHNMLHLFMKDGNTDELVCGMDMLQNYLSNLLALVGWLALPRATKINWVLTFRIHYVIICIIISIHSKYFFNGTKIFDSVYLRCHGTFRPQKSRF